MFTITRHFSKIIQPITIGSANNQYIDKYYILKHNLNIINKNINQNNISNDDIKIFYDNNNDVNKSSGVLYFKYAFVENGVKYTGKIYSRFTTLPNSSNNVEDEDDNYEHNLALKHAWSN